ncbi:MAG: vWA domain-containing protein [Nannocystaceae bacterium]
MQMHRLSFSVFGLLTLACGGGEMDTRTSESGVSGISGISGISGASQGSASQNTSESGGSESDSETDSETGSNSGSTSESGNPTTGNPTTTTPPEPCVSDEDCPGDQICNGFEGVCLDPGSCLSDQDCEGGKVCVNGNCQIGGDCGGEQFDLISLPPNLMIVLDRSGSMDGDVQGTSDNRWEVAKSAIAQVTSNFENDIRFGLTTFSACIFGSQCSAGEIILPPQPANAGAINNFLSDKGFFYLCNTGDPETSTGNTLQGLEGYPLLQDPIRSNAVLLITDGNENAECKTNTDAAMAAADLYGQPFPVKTFAVGFSDNILGSLAEVAENGGTNQPYNASNPQELESALDAIASTIASCDFQLGQAPPDADEIHVFFDDDGDNPVPNDAQNGWTYDPDTNTIHFHGEACEKIQMGLIVDIDVVYGCNTPVPG